MPDLSLGSDFSKQLYGIYLVYYKLDCIGNPTVYHTYAGQNPQNDTQLYRSVSNEYIFRRTGHISCRGQ